MGSCCDPVGKVVASETKGPQFEPGHYIYWNGENKANEAPLNKLVSLPSCSKT